MSFFSFQSWGLPQNLQKKLVKFLLKKALGQFLAHDLELDDLDVQLSQGRVVLRNLSLNCEAINDVLADLPLTVKEGYISEITAVVPWTSLWAGNCELILRGLTLGVMLAGKDDVLEKLQTEDHVHLMASSIHFADDFIKSESDSEDLAQSITQFHLMKMRQSSTANRPEPARADDGNPGAEGLQLLAMVIDKILARIQVSAFDTTLRIHHRSSISMAPTLSTVSDDHQLERDDGFHYHLDLCIPKISYCDETPGLDDDPVEPSSKRAPKDTPTARSSSILPPEITKVVSFYGIHVSLNQVSHEFTPAGIPPLDGIQTPASLGSRASQEFHHGPDQEYCWESVILSMPPEQENRVTIKTLHSPDLPSTRDPDDDPDDDSYTQYEVNVLVRCLAAFVTPSQLQILLEIVENLAKGQELIQQQRASSSARKNAPSSPPQYDRRLSVASSAPSQEPTYFLFKFHLLQLNAYATYTDNTPPPFHVATLYSLLFNNSDLFSNQAAFPAQGSDLSSSFLTQVNTQLNTRVGVGVDDVVSDYIGIEHIKVELHHLIVRLDNGKPSSGFQTPVHTLSVTLQEIEIDEWLPEANFWTPHEKQQHHPPFRTYNPILQFDPNFDTKHVSNMLAQVSGSSSHPPQPKRFPFTSPRISSSVGLAAMRPPGQHRLSSSKVKRPAVHILVESGTGSSNVTVTFAPTFLFVDFLMIDRMETLIKALQKPEQLHQSHTSGSDSEPLSHLNRDFEVEPLSPDPRSVNLTLDCPLLRGWIIPPNMHYSLSQDLHSPKKNRCFTTPEMLCIDVLGIKATSVLQSRQHGFDQRAHPAGSDALGESMQFAIEYSEVGCSLAVPAKLNRKIVDGLVYDVDVKPFLHLRHAPETNPFSNSRLDTFGNRPRIEVTVTPKVRIGQESRPRDGPAIDPFSKAAMEEDMQFGSQSWYDLGNTGHRWREGSQPGPGFDRAKSTHHDDAELWFKQITIRESLIYLNWSISAAHVALAKPELDLLQTLINQLSLWQPFRQELDPFSPSTPDPAFMTFMHKSAMSQSENQSVYEDAHTSIHIKLGPDGFASERNHENMEGYSPRLEQHIPQSEYVEAKPTPLSLLAGIDKAYVRLFSSEHPGKMTAEPSRSWIYGLDIDELKIFGIASHDGQPTSYFWIDCEDMVARDCNALTEETTRLVYRTIPRPLDSTPVLSVYVVSTFDASLNSKEASILVRLSNTTLRPILNSKIAEDLIPFFKEPEGIIYPEIISGFTKLTALLRDISIDYRPMYLPTRAIFRIEGLKAASTLITDSPTMGLELNLHSGALYLLDGCTPVQQNTDFGYLGMGLSESLEQSGFVSAAKIKELQVFLRTNRGDIMPELELEVTNQQIYIDTCADTLATTLSLIQYMASGKDIHGNAPPLTPDDTEAEDDDSLPDAAVYDDIMAHIEENAFDAKRPSQPYEQHSPGLDHDEIDAALEDDFFLRTMGQTILIEPEAEFPTAVSQKEVERTRAQVRFREKSSKQAGSATAEASEVTVRVFEGSESICFVDDYFAHSSHGNDDDSIESITGLPPSKIRIRVKDFDVTWRIFEGFDWAQSREQHSKVHSSERPKDAVPQAKVSASSTSAPQSQRRKDSFSSESSGNMGPMIVPTLDLFSYGDDLSDSFDQGAQVFKSAYGSGYFYPPVDEDSASNTYGYGSEDQISEAASRRSGHSRSVAQESVTTDRARPTPFPRPPDQSSGMLTRSQSSCIEFRATNISLELDQYLPHEQYASRLVFQIRDFEIIDNVPTSVWRKFMGHMRADGQPRETKSSMLRIEMLNVRPSPGTSPAEEMRLKVQLLPLRFYIDQDALSCLLKFFSFEDDTVPKNPGRSKTEDNTFFQWVQIEPIQVKLDYKPKHVDYSQLKDGKLTEIMNFFHLDGAELMLERVRLHGIKGWVKLVENLVREWLPHIQKTQVPRVISGVSGVRTLVNLGAGIADLFTMPIEQYKKDGRILRGIQKGTRAFAKAATLETIKLTTQLAVGTQVLLEHADDILSSDKDDQASGDGGMGREAVSKYSDQPKDVREGVGLAYRSLSRNLGTAAKTIMSVPTNMYDRGGSQSGVKAVIRAVPSAVLKPMIGATEAVSKTLIGLQNTIDPDKRLQMEDKYKGT